MRKGKHGDVFGEDGIEFKVVDSENQALTFRVGMVHHKNGKHDYGLWVYYQETKDKSKMSGPVLMSERAWKALKKFIDYKFDVYSPIRTTKQGGKK